MRAASRTQLLMAQLAIGLCIGLIVLGLLWHGASADTWERFWRDIAARLHEPMKFRFVLQPTMAAILALLDGIADARANRTPYLRTILTDPAERRDRLSDGILAVARVILLGLGMDFIYQLYVLRTFYPGEAVLVALLLAVVPYVLLRGPFTRVARAVLARKSHGPPP
jgi:hypothetical protein